MPLKIVFLDACTMGNVSFAPIEALGTLVCYPDSTRAQALERISDADVIITNKFKIDAEIISAAPRLKLICVSATGMNNIDFTATERAGIPVRNVAGYSTDSVVQMTFALLMELVCRTAAQDTYVKDGSYSCSGVFTNTSSPFMELSGKTMGIIGMGTIGRKVASVAESFGMKVIYYSTSGTSHCKDFPSVSLEQLLRESDVVSIHAPLNDRTRNLVDAPRLALMKPSAFLINIGRGGIVDEAALADAISAGTIAGAGLDVFVSEPLPQDNPLLHTTHPERLCLTPHIGWASAEAIGRLVDGVAANIRTLNRD